MATAGIADIVFDVDSEHMVRAMRKSEDALDRFVTEVARELEKHLEREGGALYPELGSDWNLDIGPFAATLRAPNEAWWAHFVARGTQAHEARDGGRMVFTIDGETVSAERVEGIPANPFHERAMVMTRTRLDDILRRLM